MEANSAEPKGIVEAALRRPTAASARGCGDIDASEAAADAGGDDEEEEAAASDGDDKDWSSLAEAATFRTALRAPCCLDAGMPTASRVTDAERGTQAGRR